MKEFIKDLMKKMELPKVGSTYTINRPGSAYNGMTGVVGHHGNGKTFYINTGKSILTNITPK